VLRVLSIYVLGQVSDLSCAVRGWVRVRVEVRVRGSRSTISCA
jgi:hypothetical protein